MSFPPLLGGAVLQWELLRARRRPWLWILHFGFVALMAFILSFELWQVDMSAQFYFGYRWPTSPETARAAEQLKALQEYFFLHGTQQLVLVVLLGAPMLAGGALGNEKERGTLLVLFATGLTAWEIVVGKLLSRMVPLAKMALLAAPLMLFAAATVGIRLDRVLLVFAQAAVLAFALLAAALLAGVWTRNTRDAILASYALVGLVYLGGVVLVDHYPRLSWLDPVEIVETLGRSSFVELDLAPLLAHLAVWGGIGAVCLVLTIVRLRRESLGQLERQPPRWRWSDRPALSDDPIRWRECYVLGLAPLPWLKIVPRWLGLVVVLGVSCWLFFRAVDNLTGDALSIVWETDDWGSLPKVFRRINQDKVPAAMAVMSGLLLVAGPLVVGVRCLNSTAEEKRRKTWEDLLLTPLTLDEIRRGKKLGVLSAALPYVAVYVAPFFGLATLGDCDAVVLALIIAVFTLVCMYLSAEIGMGLAATEYEVTSKPSLRR